MASSSSLPEDDLTCPVCMDIFTDPVGLKCSHVFCKECLQKCWEENTAGECPMCREKTTEDPSGNRVLKNLCEAFLKHRIEKAAPTTESLCNIHRETLKLFCLSDEELICFICQTSERHENHKLRPIQEAALKYKEELERELRPLQEKLEAFTKEKQKNDKDAELIKSQTESTVIQIQTQFEKLHQFLRDEEAARIAALRKEEEQKSQKMKARVETMTKEISSLSATITTLEQEMKADDFSFLQNIKATKNRAHYQTLDPEEAPGECIDIADHLGNLKYRVWKKMKGIVQYTPVILDPNTKGENITLSRNLTSLRYNGGTELSSDDDDDDGDDDDDDDDDGDDDDGDDDDDDDDDGDGDDEDDEDDDVDDDDEDSNGDDDGGSDEEEGDDGDDDDNDDDDDSEDDDSEDGDAKDDTVFGSKGLLTKQCWEVKVGDSPTWALGVAENLSSEGKPEWGRMWGLRYADGEYEVMQGAGKWTAIKRKQWWWELEGVRVRLNWWQDKLSFYDPTRKTVLCTLKCDFTHDLFPWFSIGSDSVPLRICPMKVSVAVR